MSGTQDNGGLPSELQALRRREWAIALDFDGVCKLFTEHKHQIMATCLFLHLREFQRVPFEAYRQAYVYINFRSADYAGKERFLCASALSEHLAAQGYDCALPGLHRAVAALRSRHLTISEQNLKSCDDNGQVTRALAWSREVNERVAQLTGIGLTPGLRKNILDPFAATADYYVVSTATEAPLKASLKCEGIDFILRYIGQETAPKGVALQALGSSGYRAIAYFGDSVEDARAARAAAEQLPDGYPLCFVPVIPGEEPASFRTGREVIERLLKDEAESAAELCRKQQKAFQGREVGMATASPLSIQTAT